MATHDVPRATRPRTEEERQQELDKIDKYRSLEDQFRLQVASTQFGPETLQLTTKLLRLNPEYYTVWNARRRCLLSGALSKPSNAISLPAPLANAGNASSPAEPSPTTLSESLATSTLPGHGLASETHDDGNRADQARDVIRAELDFIVPLLMQHPKCYWIWNHRTWILQQAIEKLQVSAAKALWEEELALVGKMLHRDSRNFHAWAYRRHVVSQLESPALEGQSMVDAEFEYTTKMIHKDLSNFSAWHNRSQLVCRLVDKRSSSDTARREFLDQEFELVLRGLDVGPEDQSLWYYHQFLVSNVTGHSDRPTIAPNLATSEREAIIHREIDAIKELLEDYDDIKWIYEVLVEYTFAARQLAAQTDERTESGESEVAQWLNRLRGLDPMRNGRWDDLAKSLGLA